jgi:hypothetical protein
VLGGDEDDIVDAGEGAGGDVDVALHERLGVNLAGDLKAGELAEVAAVDIAARQQGFVGVDAGARQVVVIGKDIGGEEQSPLEGFERWPDTRWKHSGPSEAKERIALSIKNASKYRSDDGKKASRTSVWKG